MTRQDEKSRDTIL